MEGEILSIRNGSPLDDKERDLAIMESGELQSDSPVSETERRILRRTRLFPRKLQPVDQEVVVVEEEDEEEEEEEESGEDEPPNTTTEQEQVPSSSSQP